jgi:hypothetical protein
LLSQLIFFRQSQSSPSVVKSKRLLSNEEEVSKAAEALLSVHKGQSIIQVPASVTITLPPVSADVSATSSLPASVTSTPSAVVGNKTQVQVVHNKTPEQVSPSKTISVETTSISTRGKLNHNFNSDLYVIYPLLLKA